MWIVYMRGAGKNSKTISYGLDLVADPEGRIAEFSDVMPFTIELAGLEVGSRERLEQLREQFRSEHLHGPWYKPSEAIASHIGALPKVDRNTGAMRRVSLDLASDEFAMLDSLVEKMGAKTKARLLRRALRFYSALTQYKAKGYLIQAVKNGKMIQFPDLEDIR